MPFLYVYSIVSLLGCGPHIRNKNEEGEFLYSFTYGRFTVSHSRIITFASEQRSPLCRTSWRKLNEKAPIGIWKETSRRFMIAELTSDLRLVPVHYSAIKGQATQTVASQCFSAGVLMRTKAVLKWVLR